MAEKGPVVKPGLYRNGLFNIYIRVHGRHIRSHIRLRAGKHYCAQYMENNRTLPYNCSRRYNACLYGGNLLPPASDIQKEYSWNSMGHAAAVVFWHRNNYYGRWNDARRRIWYSEKALGYSRLWRISICLYMGSDGLYMAWCYGNRRHIGNTRRDDVRRCYIGHGTWW